MLTRRLSLIFITILALSLMVVACGGGNPAPTAMPVPPTATPTPAGPSPETIAEGKNLYIQSCSACHGADAKGVTGLGKDMTTSDFIKSLSDEELLDFTKKGRPSGDPDNTTGVDMPPKGGNPALTDDKLTAIIAYIRSIEE